MTARWLRPPSSGEPAMKALDTKLWRDLQRLRAQVITIAVVVAIGVAGFVGMFSVHESLQGSRDSFYRDNRLADVFASVKRAPVHLGGRLAAIAGVAEVKLDVVMDAQIALPDADAPVTGRFIGLDLARAHAQRQGLNALTLRSGRWPERGRALEAVVSDRFAVARGLKPGDRVNAILNGRLEQVHLVGTAISPEYVFASRGGAPDDQTFGIWWIDHERMAHAFDLQGAFNQVALRLHAGAPERQVLAALDRLLEPFGSIGAVGRDRQLSTKIVADELGADWRRVLRWAALPVALVWALAGWALLQSPEADRWGQVLGSTWRSCPFNIALLSVPMCIACFWVLRRAAPTRLAWAGAGAGLLAGAMGALVYAVHCPEMALPFVAVWYVAGMMIPTALGALLGPRLLRW